MMHIEPELVELINGEITFVELCGYTQLPRQQVIEMIQLGLLEPLDMRVATDDQYRFSARELRRARIARRLMIDLGVNLEGAAIILELINERDALLHRVITIERLLEH
jgi:chaperone modulatory protein CbpM